MLKGQIFLCKGVKTIDFQRLMSVIIDYYDMHSKQ